MKKNRPEIIMDLVIGLKAAAKVCCCNRVTIDRYIKKGEFPLPIQETKKGSGVSRIWNKEDLLKFKPKAVGNPGFKNKI